MQCDINRTTIRNGIIQTASQMLDDSNLFNKISNVTYSPKSVTSNYLDIVQDINTQFGEDILSLNQGVYLINPSDDLVEKYDLRDKNIEEGVSYQLKSVNILLKDEAKSIFAKARANNWSLDKALQQLQIPKMQRELIASLPFTIDNSPEDIAQEIASNYSYTIKINTIKDKPQSVEFEGDGVNFYVGNQYYEGSHSRGIFYHKDLTTNITTQVSREEFDKQRLKVSQSNSSYYDNMTVPGGTNYEENEIATPAITPVIKGHAQFSTSNGIGWFRSDESQQYQEIDIQSIIDNLQKSGQLEINCN